MRLKELERKLLSFWEGRWSEGHMPWDHGRPAPPFGEFVSKKGAPAGDVLIPGAGSGHDVRYFAELGANVTGIDIAPSSIDVAHRLNSHPNAKYRLGNILNPDKKWFGRFDWVIEHTCLCALEPEHWTSYANSVRKLLKRDGYFLAIFYRNPVDDAGPPFGIGEQVIDQLFGSHFRLLDAWVPAEAYQSRINREELRWYRIIS
jgi:SAM-dependent methyltransferase